jgi:hypothetical protein
MNVKWFKYTMAFSALALITTAYAACWTAATEFCVLKGETAQTASTWQCQGSTWWSSAVLLTAFDTVEIHDWATPSVNRHNHRFWKACDDGSGQGTWWEYYNQCINQMDFIRLAAAFYYASDEQLDCTP